MGIGCMSDVASARTPPSLRTGGLGIFVLLALGFHPDSAEAQRPTFVDDVAPILYRDCAVCHRPEGPAPFSLLSYDDARKYAPLIAAAVERRFMPPWLPSSGHGEFAAERRLDKRDIELIRRWADNGAPQGDPTTAPEPPRWPDGWQLGDPDLVVDFPSFTLSVGSGEQYRNFVARVPIDETRFVEAIEVRPGNYRVVHHARLMVDSTASSRDEDARDPAPGFDGMEVVSAAASPEGFFIGWTPGRVQSGRGDGLAWRLDPGTDLVLQLHLRPSDATEQIRARVGLHFAEKPPARYPSVVMLGSRTVDIPAGKSDYVVVDSFPLPVAVQVLGVYPHAHYLATRMEGYARLPNGKRRWLILIEDWDFNWQDEYHYRKPIALPEGSVLFMRYVYDNSSTNLRNPSSPPQRVRYGPTSRHEMADLVVQVLPRKAADRDQLERKLGWKYYVDDVSRWAYLARIEGDEHLVAGRVQDAIASYREALGHRADDADAHHGLARALIEAGRGDAAVPHLEEAIRLVPEGAGPLITWAQLLGDSSSVPRDVQQATRLAERAVEYTESRDPGALDLLAALYAAAGRRADAVRVAEQAVAAAEASGDPALVAKLQDRLAQYRRFH